MNQTQFLLLYLTLLTLEYLTLITLTILNINSVLKNRKSIPELFKEIITTDNYKKNIAYTIKKEHFTIFKTTFSTLTTLVILFSGVLKIIENYLMNITDSPVIMGLLYLAALSIIISIIQLPISLYSTFVVEEEFGFNKMTFKNYVTDSVKETIVGAILGGSVLTVLFSIMERTGSSWWVWFSIFFILFQLIIFIIYPIFIAPIFNKFTPLEEGELKEKVAELSKKANFSLKGIFVMDGSKRSGHSNAYFTGFGKGRRIVLYDTLIDGLSTEELCGVLAHEIGHWKKGHIAKRFITTIITLPIVLYILSLGMNFTPLYTTFGLEPGSYHGLIALIMLISGPFTLFITPISNIISRKHEFEADTFAKELTGESKPLIDALLNLSKDNMSNLTPHIGYSTFHYSHPPVSERVKNLNH